MAEHMVNILETLDHVRIFRLKEIFSEINMEISKVFVYETQAQTFVEFIYRFGIVNRLIDELKEVALPDLIDEVPDSQRVLIYFKNEFSNNMLYTYEISNYSVKIDEDDKYTMLAVDLIPVTPTP